MSLQVATELEQSFVESINASRAAAGLPALKIEAHLNASAQSHSDWMADTGDMGHEGEGGSDPGDRVEDAGFPLTAPARVTENVGYVNVAGRLDADEVDRLHDGLMQSEDHRDNILDPNVSYVGIGLATGTRSQNGIDYDAVYVTQNFAETAGEVLVQEEVDGETVFQPYQDGEPVGDPQPAENTPPDDPAEEVPQEPDEEEEQASESASGGGCFVATAAYGSWSHPDVAALRLFRDEVLAHHPAGRAFIRTYRVVGPKLARFVSPKGRSGRAARALIAPLARRARVWADRR
jgi:hypothetical protein